MKTFALLSAWSRIRLNCVLEFEYFVYVARFCRIKSKGKFLKKIREQCDNLHIYINSLMKTKLTVERFLPLD